jgi:hypothetical protein
MMQHACFAAVAFRTPPVLTVAGQDSVPTELDKLDVRARADTVCFHLKRGLCHRFITRIDGEFIRGQQHG